MPWFRKPGRPRSADKPSADRPSAGKPGSSPATSGDRLFDTISAWQAGRPWGSVLDAGTGEHSLGWIAGLQTTRWTAVTAGVSRQQALQRGPGSVARPVDRVLTGNWLDEHFLEGERFDTVLADYLLGAVAGFAPYFQDRLFSRLRPHVAGRLYVVGLEPVLHAPTTDAQGDDMPAPAIIRRINQLRDACILLAGHRCYREYPRSWVERRLVQDGFVIEQATNVPIVYGPRYIDGQLDVCLRKLPHFADPALATATRAHVEDLRKQALALHDELGGLHVGSDYIVAARPG